MSDTNNNGSNGASTPATEGNTEGTTPATSTPDTSTNTPAPQTETPADNQSTGGTPSETPASDAPASTSNDGSTDAGSSSSSEGSTETSSTETSSTESTATDAGNGGKAPTSVPNAGSKDSTGGGDFAFMVTGAKEASARVPAGTSFKDAYKKATGVTPATSQTYRDGSGKDVDFNATVTKDTTITAVTKARAG